MGVTGGIAAMGMMSIGSAYSQSKAQQSQADFTAAQYAENQKIAGVESDDAVMRGDLKASQADKQMKAQVGAQRVAAAAGGVEVTSGSALELQSDTEAQGQLNMLTIKNNAWREAWGYKMQAASDGAMGNFAALAGKNQSNNTLLTGGMNAASYGIKGYGYYSANNSATPGGDTPYTDANYTMPSFGSTTN